jgi:hypothetical protein
VEIEDLHRFRRIEDLSLLSPRYPMKDSSLSTSLGLFLLYPLREYVENTP